MTTVDGVPAHALLVHAVVVLVPLAAVLLVMTCLWSSARRRFALLTAVLSTLALVSIPVTTSAGEWLEHHVARTALVRTHTHLGDTLLPWGTALFALAAVVAVREQLRRRGAADRTDTGAGSAERSTAHGFGGAAVTAGLAVLAIIVAAGSIITVYRVGESGARAAWTGHFNAQANPPSPHHRTKG